MKNLLSEVCIVSSLTSKPNVMYLKASKEKLLKWIESDPKKRAFVQDEFPELSPEEREFLLSGITPEEWYEAFGENENPRSKYESQPVANRRIKTAESNLTKEGVKSSVYVALADEYCTEAENNDKADAVRIAECVNAMKKVKDPIGFMNKIKSVTKGQPIEDFCTNFLVLQAKAHAVIEIGRENALAGQAEMESCHNEIIELRKQRDELLAALECVVDHIEINFARVWGFEPQILLASQAIAKAKGGSND